MEVRDLGGLARAHDFDSTLVDVTLREHLDEAVVGPTIMLAPEASPSRFRPLSRSPSRGPGVVVVVIVAVPFMPGFSSRTDIIFPSMSNRSRRLPSFPSCLRQLDDELVAVHRMISNFLVSAWGRLRHCDRGRQAHERTTQRHPNRCPRHRASYLMLRLHVPTGPHDTWDISEPRIFLPWVVTQWRLFTGAEDRLQPCRLARRGRCTVAALDRRDRRGST